MARPPLVVIESPWLGGTTWAVLYARLALEDALRAGSIPFASHLLYTQALKDADPTDRELGLQVGWVPYSLGAMAQVYVDFGITLGMQRGIIRARRIGCEVVYRAFGPDLRRRVLDAAVLGADDPQAVAAPHGPSQPIAWPEIDSQALWEVPTSALGAAVREICYCRKTPCTCGSSPASSGR